MAMEIIQAYREHVPALRFIGKRYTNGDRGGDGGFGAQWDQWHEANGFTALRRAVGAPVFDSSQPGLMTMRGDMGDFAYWIGLFFPAGTAVPEGYGFVDLPESDLGTAWVRGSLESGELFGDAHGKVCKKLAERGLGEFRSDIAGPGSDTYCFAERYQCPRFTEKDAEGRVILDYINYIF